MSQHDIELLENYLLRKYNIRPRNVTDKSKAPSPEQQRLRQEQNRKLSQIYEQKIQAIKDKPEHLRSTDELNLLQHRKKILAKA